LGKAKAEAQARLVKAEAKALQLIAEVVNKQPDLLTYNYIDKLSPNMKAMILPHDTPLILPLPSLNDPQTKTWTPTNTLKHPCCHQYQPIEGQSSPSMPKQSQPKSDLPQKANEANQ